MYRVILVGRPNAGKSTLFNALAGKRKSIVSPQAHATRDLLHSLVKSSHKTWVLTDMGGIGVSEDPLDNAAMGRGWKELTRVDVALVVVDLTDFGPEDRKLLDRIRKTGIPLVVAGNKIDDSKSENTVDELYRAGFPQVIPVSALEERGVEEVREAVGRAIGRLVEEGLPPKDPLLGENLARAFDATVVLLGRPNAGKSSLMNRFLKSERALVGEKPGTTRDAVVDFVTRNGKRIRMFDTAGLRRRSSLKGLESTLEGRSVEKTVGSMHAGDAAILVIDGTEDLAEQDKKIAAVAVHHRKNLIVAVNKWDLVQDKRWVEYEDRLRYLFPHIRTVPVIPVSAKTGLNIEKLLETALTQLSARQTRFPTAELNRILQRAMRERPPSAAGGGVLKVFYGVQLDGEPPVFRVFINGKKRLVPNYAKYLENALVNAKELGGTPIRVEFRDHDSEHRRKNDEEGKAVKPRRYGRKPGSENGEPPEGEAPDSVNEDDEESTRGET